MARSFFHTGQFQKKCAASHVAPLHSKCGQIPLRACPICTSLLLGLILPAMIVSMILLSLGSSTHGLHIFFRVLSSTSSFLILAVFTIAFVASMMIMVRVKVMIGILSWSDTSSKSTLSAASSQLDLSDDDVRNSSWNNWPWPILGWPFSAS